MTVKNTGNRHGKLKTALALFLLFGSLFYKTHSLAGAPRYDFFYFNPDSLQSNLDLLKKEFDTFFAETNNPIYFQPFAHLLDFEKTAKESKPAFLIVPAWYFKKFGRELNLKPLLIPVRQNATTYQKVLLTTSDSGIELANLGNHTMAMTTMGPDAPAILENILSAGRKINISTLNIVVVPKDTDALFALILGQVDLALVAKGNIDQLKKINPRIVQSVRPLHVSKPVSLPLLCYIENMVSEKETEKLKDTFMGEQTGKERQRIMEMLKIDGWKKYTK